MRVFSQGSFHSSTFEFWFFWNNFLHKNPTWSKLWFIKTNKMIHLLHECIPSLWSNRLHQEEKSHFHWVNILAAPLLQPAQRYTSDIRLILLSWINWYSYKVYLHLFYLKFLSYSKSNSSLNENKNNLCLTKIHLIHSNIVTNHKL